MKWIPFSFFCILLIIGCQLVHSQTTADGGQRYAYLGSFDLENGEQINDCKIGYRTYGRLNANRTNAVIYPTGGGATTEWVASMGVGADVDTTKFYLIMIDALGNGVSSSPSNSPTQFRILFPVFTIRDMVNSQYKMLTENLHIQHLAAVVGGSMGGMQALQWAISYPLFMDKVVAIEATPKLSAYDLLWMNTYIEAVKSDTAYRGGNYNGNPFLKLASYVSLLVMTTPANLNKSASANSFQNWIETAVKEPLPIDCNNFLWQLKAILTHDITATAGGSFEAAAARIKAKMLIITNQQDHVISPAHSIQFARIAKAKLVVMNNELGHLVFGDKIPVMATRKFLRN